MNAIFGVDPSVAVLNRRTRDRFALGVGGSYGQGDYWLGQLDPASPQEPLRCADSEPRVLKSWKDALTLTPLGQSWQWGEFYLIFTGDVNISVRLDYQGKLCCKKHHDQKTP